MANNSRNIDDFTFLIPLRMTRMEWFYKAKYFPYREMFIRIIWDRKNIQRQAEAIGIEVFFRYVPL